MLRTVLVPTTSCVDSYQGGPTISCPKKPPVCEREKNRPPHKSFLRAPEEENPIVHIIPRILGGGAEKEVVEKGERALSSPLYYVHPLQMSPDLSSPSSYGKQSPGLLDRFRIQPGPSSKSDILPSRAGTPYCRPRGPKSSLSLALLLCRRARQKEKGQSFQSQAPFSWGEKRQKSSSRFLSLAAVQSSPLLSLLLQAVSTEE